MNTYNDNLHDGIVSILQSQELQIQNENNQLNAALFSLYYAQGATLTATDQLKASKAIYAFQEGFKNQAVINSNISNNLLATTGQANNNVQQSAANNAIAAANIQTASNAIVKLASDIGSLMSIINAADCDTELYTQCIQANDKMNTVAYNAEQTSQFAMELTMHTAEISAQDLNTKSNTANSLIAQLLNTANTQFTTSTSVVAANNTALSIASVNEKLAEGVFEDYFVDYLALWNAFNQNNTNLNFQLNVVPDKVAQSFTVSFNAYEIPFDPIPGATPIAAVENYYIMVVKAENLSTFTISNAESVLLTTNNSFFKIKANPSKTNISQTINISKSEKQETDNAYLVDVDGKEIMPGNTYAVFVLIEFTKPYKKLLDSYEDYLLAPSMPFVLTYQFVVPPDSNFKFVVENKSEEKHTIHAAKKPTPHKHNKSFKKLELQVQYRCIFLQAKIGKKLADNSTNIIQDMLNETNFENSMELFKIINYPFDTNFNLELAQEVSEANYTIAVENDNQHGHYTISIKPDTTDNFGNPLNPEYQYYYAILAVYNGSPEFAKGYTNALSSLLPYNPKKK